MHPHVGLEGQRSRSSLCQFIRKSIDQFAGVEWCFWKYTCLSVSNSPGTEQRRYTPLRVNKEFRQTHTRTGESYIPVHLCRACLSLERDCNEGTEQALVKSFKFQMQEVIMPVN